MNAKTLTPKRGEISLSNLDQWVNDNMALLIIGLVVVLAASVLVVRALLRARAARDGLTVEQRDVRARRVEDGLTVAVAMVASGLSLTGLWYYAQDVLHLTGAWRVLPYFGLDAAVIVCAIRARRRARNNEAAGWNGRLVWIFALISAAFGFSEGGSVWGGFGRAVWPLIAATLFELGLIEQRHAAQRNTERRLNLGWAHPIERLRVYSMLSSDSTLTADDATHQVRVNAAARALYRLRHAETDAKPGRRWARGKLRRVEHRTQRVLLRARFADPRVAAEVMQRMQSMVRTREFARMDYTLDVARSMMEEAIDHSVLPAGTRRSRPVHKPEQKTARAPESAPAAAPSAPVPATRQPEQAPANARAEAPAERADVDQDARSIEDIVREIARQMIAEDDSVKPDGTLVRQRAGLDRDDKPVPQTTRNWIADEYKQHLAARASEPGDARADLRAEVRIAEPPEREDIEDAPPAPARHAASNVA